MVVFNIHGAGTDTKSYLSHSPIVVLAEAEAEKKRKYCDPSTKCHATFTLLCFSVHGLHLARIKLVCDLGASLW